MILHLNVPLANNNATNSVSATAVNLHLGSDNIVMNSMLSRVLTKASL
jgi:hypothetical protein